MHPGSARSAAAARAGSPGRRSVSPHAPGIGTAPPAAAATASTRPHPTGPHDRCLTRAATAPRAPTRCRLPGAAGSTLNRRGRTSAADNRNLPSLSPRGEVVEDRVALRTERTAVLVHAADRGVLVRDAAELV